MQSRRRSAHSPRRTGRILGILTGLCVVGLLGNWWALISDTPQVTVPNPVMPHPNAFDFYVAAGNGLVNKQQVEDAVALKPTVPLTLEQKEALVRQNAAVLPTLHQGFAYDYRNPPARSFSTPFPDFARFRGMTRLLSLQSRVRAARGDWGGAADSALDAIRLGEDIPWGAGLIASNTGILCQEYGQKALWKTVEHLNAAQSRGAAQRLESIMNRQCPFTNSLQEEKWMVQASLKELFRSMSLKKALDQAEFDSQVSFPLALHLLYGKKKILQGYTVLMDASIARAHHPYAAKLPPPPVPADPVNQMMNPVSDSAWFRSVHAETQNSLLLVALALQAYRLETGRYPASLEALAPTYLKKLPPDPFALQGSLQYRLEGQKYVLYSVGPDGKDDGGRSIDDPINNPNSAPVVNSTLRYRVSSDSLGDIVAGRNLP